MTENDGTFSKLMEMAEAAPAPSAGTKPEALPATTQQEPASPQPVEDLTTTPYISQNYRFTEDELHWLRRRAYELSEEIGVKVSQNTILRIALRELRAACERNPETNPLTKSVTRLKK